MTNRKCKETLSFSGNYSLSSPESSSSSFCFSINSSSSDSHACDGWDKPGAKENEESSCNSNTEAKESLINNNW